MHAGTASELFQSAWRIGAPSASAPRRRAYRCSVIQHGLQDPWSSLVSVSSTSTSVGRRQSRIHAARSPLAINASCRGTSPRPPALLIECTCHSSKGFIPCLLEVLRHALAPVDDVSTCMSDLVDRTRWPSLGFVRMS